MPITGPSFLATAFFLAPPFLQPSLASQYSKSSIGSVVFLPRASSYAKSIVCEYGAVISSGQITGNQASSLMSRSTTLSDVYLDFYFHLVSESLLH